MIGPLLYCKVFGLPAGLSEAYLELARRWSGQASLLVSGDQSVQWDSQTTMEIAGDRWHEAPPRVEFHSHNALIPLGSLATFPAFAFVSPLPVVAAAFKSAASRYMRQHQNNGRSIINFSLNLHHMADDLSNLPPIRGIDGTTLDGFHFVVHAPRDAFPHGFRSSQHIPQMKELYSLELDIGQTVTVDNSYGVSITDVSEEHSAIASSLVSLFRTLQKYTSPAPM